ncbi:MAG: hypothetical protein R3293_18885 [Candidatus Promineifilaceae bacterium]|nr:hypothetical protein [Candidatus Promineifilaceae bacterium]
METHNNEPGTTTVDNWKTKTYIIGAVAGALIGLGTAFLMTRSADERGGGPPEVSTGDLLKVGVGVIGLVRGIAALGD